MLVVTPNGVFRRFFPTVAATWVEFFGNPPPDSRYEWHDHEQVVEGHVEGVQHWVVGDLFFL